MITPDIYSQWPYFDYSLVYTVMDCQNFRMTLIKNGFEHI